MMRWQVLLSYAPPPPNSPPSHARDTIDPSQWKPVQHIVCMYIIISKKYIFPAPSNRIESNRPAGVGDALEEGEAYQGGGGGHETLKGDGGRACWRASGRRRMRRVVAPLFLPTDLPLPPYHAREDAAGGLGSACFPHGAVSSNSYTVPCFRGMEDVQRVVGGLMCRTCFRGVEDVQRAVGGCGVHVSARLGEAPPPDAFAP